jgi:hypothetical protein
MIIPLMETIFVAGRDILPVIWQVDYQYLDLMLGIE